MGVTRIVANLAAPDPTALAEFYRTVFQLDLEFDMGWIAFLGRDTTQKVELHTASQGGSGTPLPVISIGVDDLDTTESAIRAAGVESSTAPWRRVGAFGAFSSSIRRAIWSMSSITD